MQSKWNLKPLYNADTDPKIAKDRKRLHLEAYKFINKWKNRADYLQNPKTLKLALDEYEDWARNFGSSGSEGYYLSLRTAQDEIYPKLKALENKLNDFSTKIANDIQFFELKIAKIDPKLQSKFLKSPELKEYKHFFERLFSQSKHLLTEPEEKILNLKSQTAYSNWIKMTSSFITKEERIVLDEKLKKSKKNFSELMSLLSSTNKKVRDKAAKAVNEIFEKHSDVAENELNSILQDHKINDELRKFSRPDSARILSDDMESDTVDALLTAVTNKFDTAKRFYKLKAKLLKTNKLKYHERNVPIGKITKKYTFNESIKIINEAFIKLDPEFSQILQIFVKNGQIDVFPQKGKTGGAFCAHNTIPQPTYILLNHDDKFNDVLTFAHELGHGINNELIKKKQNELNFGTPLSTAEVASTFMEDFVIQELMQNVDNETRLAIIMNKLNDDISTIYRQIACYNFEKDLHTEFRKKGYLPKEEIGRLFTKHMSTYMGDYVEQSKGSQNWWIYWSHIRRFFYVYSYSSGLLISKSLQNSVKKDVKFIKEVKEFLSAGLSDSPKNIFAKLGIDITDKKFWLKGLKEVDELLNEAENLAKILKV